MTIIAPITWKVYLKDDKGDYLADGKYLSDDCSKVFDMLNMTQFTMRLIPTTENRISGGLSQKKYSGGGDIFDTHNEMAFRVTISNFLNEERYVVYVWMTYHEYLNTRVVPSQFISGVITSLCGTTVDLSAADIECPLSFKDEQK